MIDKRRFDEDGYVVAGALFEPDEATFLRDYFMLLRVPLPDDAELVPAVMEPGDVLFFNGSLVHGSKPNRSDRFRRSLVGHYIEGDARQCSLWYHPALRLDGTTVELEQGVGGGPCGEWVERDGRPAIELGGVSVDPRTTE